MDNGTRLAMSLLVGGGAAIASILVLTTASALLTGGPPNPKFIVLVIVAGGVASTMHWKYADAVERWMRTSRTASAQKQPEPTETDMNKAGAKAD